MSPTVAVLFEEDPVNEVFRLREPETLDVPLATERLFRHMLVRAPNAAARMMKKCWNNLAAFEAAANDPL